MVMPKNRKASVMTTSIPRFITNSGASATSIVSLADRSINAWPGADAGDAVLWNTATVPVAMARDVDADARKIGTTLKKGSAFRVTELGPAFKTPMHRTSSTDYGIVLSGELELLLDGGDAVTLFPGDALVQRGTRHAWRNPSGDTRCRFMMCMIEAEPVMVGGRSLQPTPLLSMIIESLMMKFRGTGVAARTSSQEAPPLLRTARRLVTRHDASGKAVVMSQSEVAKAPLSGEGASQQLIWQTQSVPADNSLDVFHSDTHPGGAFVEAGSSFRIITLDPGAVTTIPRSMSIAYCMMLSGDLQFEVVDGISKSLRTGDTIIVRGTGSRLRNPSRISSCMLAICSIEGRSA